MSSTKNKSKPKVLLNKPTKPKAPNIKELVPVTSNNFGKAVVDKVFDLHDELAKSLSDKWKVDYRDDDYSELFTAYFYDGSSDEETYDASFYRKLADTIYDTKYKLPDGWTKVVHVTMEGTHCLCVSMELKSPPSVEYVSKKQAAYDKAVEKYEQDMEIYNSEASKKARLAITNKEAEKAKSILQKKKAQLAKLGAEMKALEKLAKGA